MNGGASRTVRIVNERGLHARASAKVVSVAERFDAEIVVRHDGEEADARSIMDLLTLAAPCGADIEIAASGADAEAALEALTTLIASKFGEER